jgi:hypothetical protein
MEQEQTKHASRRPIVLRRDKKPPGKLANKYELSRKQAFRVTTRQFTSLVTKAPAEEEIFYDDCVENLAEMCKLLSKSNFR